MLSLEAVMELKQRRRQRSGLRGNVSELAREFQISRQTVYNATQRLEEGFNGHLRRTTRAQRRRLEKEVRKLREELSFTREYLRVVEAGPEVSWRHLEDFVLACAVRGVTLRGVVELVKVAFGVQRSHTWAKGIIDRASKKAQQIFEKLRPWERAGQIVADEIFLGSTPLLLIADPQSLAVLRLSVEERRDAEAWRGMFEVFEEVEGIASDLGKGLLTAIRALGWAHQADLFHAVKIVKESLRKWERRCYQKIREEYEWEKKLRKQRRRGKDCRGIATAYGRAREKTEQALLRFDEAERVVRNMRQIMELVDRNGRWISLRQREGTLEEGLKRLTELGLPHIKKVKGYWAHENLLTFARKVEEALGKVHIEVRGLSREQVLDAATGLWAHQNGKIRGRRSLVAVLRCVAGTRACLDFPPVAEQVGKILNHALRASSAIECLNSMWRVYQQVKKSFGTKFAYLVALYHNMRPFCEGPRKGRTPFELLGVSLPTNNWLNLLRQ